MRPFTWLRPFTKGLGHARGPDPGGSTTRALHKPTQRLAHQQAAHQSHSATQSHLHSAPLQHSSKSPSPQQALSNLFNSLFPAISHSARATLHAAPSTLAQSHASLASRNFAHLARATVRAGRSGSSGLGAGSHARPAIRGGGLTGPPPVHQVGLGTARGFATGAGRPVLQNVQNAPQYLRAMLDQEDRLRKEGKGRKGSKARMVRERKVTPKGHLRRSARMERDSYFPVVGEKKEEKVVTKSEAIVLTVPLEPTSTQTEIFAESVSISTPSTSQGHLFTNSFLSVIRSREEQLLRAQRIFDDVQSVIADGSASYYLRSGTGAGSEQPALVVKFDARKWTLMDVRALLGLWDMGEVAGEVWYAIREEREGWVGAGGGKAEKEEDGSSSTTTMMMSEVTTISEGISIDLDSELDSPSDGVFADHEHDHDLAAHDHVLETLQLPSIMFGASFMSPSTPPSPPTTSSSMSMLSSRPSLSRFSTGTSFSLSPVDESLELESYDGSTSTDDNGEEGYVGSVREFIQEVDSLSGRFPRAMRNEGWASDGWEGQSMGSWRI